MPDLGAFVKFSDFCEVMERMVLTRALDMHKYRLLESYKTLALETCRLLLERGAVASRVFSGEEMRDIWEHSWKYNAYYLVYRLMYEVKKFAPDQKIITENILSLLRDNGGGMTHPSWRNFWSVEYFKYARDTTNPPLRTFPLISPPQIFLLHAHAQTSYAFFAIKKTNDSWLNLINSCFIPNFRR